MSFHALRYSLHAIQKIAALCLIAFLFTLPAHASWTIQNSGVSNDLFAVDFPVNENTGFAVGTRGTILKTTDAGNSWKKMSSGVRDNLTDVTFINDQVGYATGVNGTILKTTNGGSSWSKLNSGTTQHLLTVHFPVDASTGYVGGNVSTLLKTTNGGQTWTPLTINGGYVYDIVFPQNANTGYVSAIDGSQDYIYKTTNGGLNWVQVLYLEDAFIQSMSFPLDDQTGYVANYATYTQPGGIWKTTDGGATWNFMTQGITSVPVAIDFPVDAQFGLAVGFSGAIIKTTDGGINWSEGSLAVSNTMEDVDLLNNNVGYAVGRGGLIAKTSDGGNPPIVSLYLHPTASGRINTFTGISGCGTDWDCVNDQSGNLGSGLPQAVNFGDYIADGSGNRAMFALDNGVISANQTVSKMCVSTAVTQYTGPYASLSYQRVGIDIAPIDTLPFWMGNYWVTGIQTWCWSNLNWTATDLDALEIGVKTVNGEWLEVSQLYARVYTTAP